MESLNSWNCLKAFREKLTSLVQKTYHSTKHNQASGCKYLLPKCPIFKVNPGIEQGLI